MGCTLLQSEREKNYFSHGLSWRAKGYIFKDDIFLIFRGWWNNFEDNAKAKANHTKQKKKKEIEKKQAKQILF